MTTPGRIPPHHHRNRPPPPTPLLEPDSPRTGSRTVCPTLRPESARHRQIRHITQGFAIVYPPTPVGGVGSAASAVKNSLGRSAQGKSSEEEKNIAFPVPGNTIVN